jgi:ribonuclease HII
MPKGKTPTRTEEGKLKRQGHRHIAGADEAGRGAWAGPLVAAAVVLPEDFDAEGVRDSKQLSPAEREWAFVQIVKQALAWAVHQVEVEEIDRRGIGEANRRALTEAIRKLSVKPHAALIDAVRVDLAIPVKPIIRGDEKETAIAAASIVAKVVRDRLMDTYGNEFTQWGFGIHKGYGTPRHSAALREYGVSPIHRRSFSPVAIIIGAAPKRKRGAGRRRTAPKGGYSPR